VINAGGGNLRVAFRLSQYERALKDRYRADKARELGNVALEQLLSELEVAKDALQRVCVR